MPRTFLFFCLLLPRIISVAQTFTVAGRIIDAKDKSPLIGVNIFVTNTADSTQSKGTVTDIDGNFTINDLQKGNYSLNISYISYKTVIRIITVNDTMNVGTISMSEESRLLKEVLIQDK